MVQNRSDIVVSVIIPYYQREHGILRRALQSVLRQKPGAGTVVDVIVVDDGSPIPVQPEVDGLVFAPPFHLTVISQSNEGVASARNTGLISVNATTKYIAFLDSDDSWHEGHLGQGIMALEQGFDFYFCDNGRDGHHESYFTNCTLLKAPIAKYFREGGIVPLTRDEISTSILREFPTQASTVIYRRNVAPTLLFDTSFTCSGEDIVFFMQLVDKAETFCFSPEIGVDCGMGVNLYFGNLSWDSPGHLAQVFTNLRAHSVIKSKIALSRANDIWNDWHINVLKRNIAFLSLRHFLKTRGKWPVELRAFAHDVKNFFLWFPASLLQVGVGRALGVYHPD